MPVKIFSKPNTKQYQSNWYKVFGNKSKKKCDHKFIDSKICLKCGWNPNSEISNNSNKE